MKTLTIKDLARTEQLDRTAMSAVRGGWNMCTPSYSPCPTDCGPGSDYSPVYDSSLHATQNLQQYQNVINPTANGSAFLNGVYATNTTTQFGQNNISVGH